MLLIYHVVVIVVFALFMFNVKTYHNHKAVVCQKTFNLP